MDADRPTGTVGETVELVAFVALTRVVADVVDTDLVARRPRAVPLALVHICVTM